jgi:CRP/FNR family transcriptional regulator, nitrogen fixation regulation protein
MTTHTVRQTRVTDRDRAGSPQLAASHEVTALDNLESCAGRIECRQGQPIVGRGDPLNYLYRVVSGVARKCLVSPNGRRQIVDLLVPGDFFGLATHEEICFSFEAVVEGTVLASYPRKRIEELAKADPRVASEVQDLLLRAIGRLQAQLLIIGRTSATAKVGAFLLSMEERLACAAAGNVVLPMSRYDIADYLAISVETVSRAVTTLKQRHAISLTGARHLRILDHVELDQDDRRGPHRVPEAPPVLDRRGKTRARYTH